jgi:ectoine hydroxylase-related dioxygenase (phytanoyl-CoA dioxygenase family)
MARHVAIEEEQIARYQRDGAVLLKSILNPDELELLERGVEEAYAQPEERTSVVRSQEGEGETRIGTIPSADSPSLAELMRSGVAAQIAARLMRTPSAQLVHEQTFYKSRGRIVPTPWHQDTPFLCVRGMDMCRVWLTCDRSPADLTVQFVRGSHRWNVVYSTDAGRTVKLDRDDKRPEYSYADIGEANLPIVPDVATYRDSFDILSFDVEPGDALVFQGNMLHGAPGREYHDSPRRAFATMWGGPELRYHEARGRSFPPPGDPRPGAVPDGARIGDHEAAFPLGWRGS